MWRSLDGDLAAGGGDAALVHGRAFQAADLVAVEQQAVGAGEERVVVKKGQMVIVNAMTVTLSTDHRCVDGALGAELLGAFKRYIENPMGMLV